MNQKQLANVLIKIIGVFACLTAIPRLAYDILLGTGWGLASTPGHTAIEFFHAAISVLLEVAIALIFICKSQSIADFLFKHDEP